MITNKSDISLALAVWLVHDNYDRIDEPNYISATSLMKPLRHIVLIPRVDRQATPPDVEEFISRALGNSIHNSIEKAWLDGYQRSLKLLGYPPGAIERVKINPTEEEVRSSNEIIPIYLEQRIFRKITVNNTTFTIGGKFDLVTEGIIQDAKSTSAYSWVKGTKDDDYQLQMSLYRWIDAAQSLRRITEDYGRINFIFTDWQKAQASNPNYPSRRVMHKDIPLLSLDQTEQWVRSKLTLIQKHKNTPEELLPECTDEELWRSDPVHKYYADPAKTAGRSTKNFPSLVEARNFMAEKGGKGVVVSVPGEPKRCGYCEAFPICTQRRRYFDD